MLVVSIISVLDDVQIDWYTYLSVDERTLYPTVRLERD